MVGFVDGDHWAATERVGDFLHPKDDLLFVDAQVKCCGRIDW